MLKISKIAVPGVAEPYDIGTLSIPFGQVDSTSTDTAYTAQIEGITSLYDGVCVYLKNGVITSNKNGFTLNINGLGAKPVYDTLAAATRSGTVFNVDYTMLFVYNSSRVSGGCWDIFYGYNSDTTDLEEALTPLTGTTGTLTPMQVYNAIKSGKSVILQYMDDTYGLLSYTNFNVAESMNIIAANSIVYFNNTYVLAELYGETTTNVWGFETTTLAQKQDIPTKLPNPNALTFTGAVTGSYDGSAQLTVEIPSGGSGSSDAWNLIEHITAEDAAISYEIPLQPGAKEYGIYWKYTLPDGVTAPQRDISVDESLAQWGLMYRCTTNEPLFVRVHKGPSNILVTGQGIKYAAHRFSNGGTYIGSGTDFPAMTLKTNKACTTSEIWVYWR